MLSLRDTPLHVALRTFGFGRTYPYPEEEPDFLAPTNETFQRWKRDSKTTMATSSLSNNHDNTNTAEKTPSPQESNVQHSSHEALPDDVDEKYILVDWYDANDPGNPRNWSKSKKLWIVGVICWYTFVVYSSSAIFVPADIFVRMRFGVSQELASLSLSMYVVGYGIGPMLFSPISEIARVGRNIPYLISFVAFLVVSIVIAIVADKSFAALVVLRLVQGFFGSPILASGGASLEDILDITTLPYAFIVWIAAMYCGPALGPVMSSYAIVTDWRWPLWEIIIMCGPLLIFLPLLPETSAPKILYERAARLRRITGNQRYRCKAELVKLDATAVVIDALIKPIEIAVKDPAVGFVSIYGALLYATYYSFFEAFPIVYAGIYDLTLQSIALIFICVVVGVIIFGGMYTAWLYYIYNPALKQKDQTPESRLRPALLAVFLLPASLFLFAWSSHTSVHWIVPTIGITIYAGTSFVIFQCIVCYVPLTYPRYVASLFAGNDFCRACLAAGFVMFSRPMYLNLGIARGVSLLAGLSVMGILGIWYLYLRGAYLRGRSKFAAG